VLLMMARQAVVAERCLSVGETAAAPSIGVARVSSALRLGLHRLLARCRRFGVVQPKIVRSRSSRRLGLGLEACWSEGWEAGPSFVDVLSLLDLSLSDMAAFSLSC
jgi:hypothetical protein